MKIKVVYKKYNGIFNDDCILLVVDQIHPTNYTKDIMEARIIKNYSSDNLQSIYKENEKCHFFIDDIQEIEIEYFDMFNLDQVLAKICKK